MEEEDMITTEEFIEWLNSKKKKSNSFCYADKYAKGFDDKLDEVFKLVNKYSYTLEFKEKLKSLLYTLRRETNGCISNRHKGQEDAILCCLSFIHGNKPKE